MRQLQYLQTTVSTFFTFSAMIIIILMHHQRSQINIHHLQPERQSYISRNIVNLSPFIANPITNPKKYININKNYLFEFLKIYEWRVNTEFPIVKILSYKIIQTNQYNYVLQVENEEITSLLHDLKELSLHKMLYLLKESLIGYERLYTRYGAFEINDKMIGVNKYHKCKIWLNSELVKNYYKSLEISEMDFIESICQIFKKKLISNKLSQEFIRELSQYATFSSILKFIDQFAKNNKLTIPSFFAKFQTNIQEKDKYFNPNLTMHRAPKFLQKKKITPLEKNQLENSAITSLGNISLPQYSGNLQASSLDSSNELNPRLKQMLKISGETRVDLKDSNTNTLMTESNDNYTPPKIFRSFNEIKRKQSLMDMHRPQQLLQFKNKGSPIKKTALKRNPFTCFTPKVIKNNYKNDGQSNWIMNSFLDSKAQTSEIIQEEEHGVQTGKNEIQNQLDSLFEKNHWQNKIEGLFSAQSDLKSSFLEGDAPKWKVSKHQRELCLLNSVKGELFESQIIEQ